MKVCNSIFFFYILVCTILLQACVTDKYDFDKPLSMGLSFDTEGLQVPGESDIDIPLSQIIELSDSSDLLIEPLTGNYLFYKLKDDMDTVTINIAHGSLCNGTQDFLDFSLHENPSVELTPNKRYPDFASMTFESKISPSFAPDVLKPSIRELLYMKVNLDVEVVMSFEGIKGFSYFNELKYEIPFFFVVENEAELSETNVKAEGIHTHKIHVVGVDFSRTSPYEGDQIGIDPETRQLLMHGDVRIKGTAKTVNTADFQAATDAKINYRISVGTLGTLAVTGRFNQHEEIDIEPLDFDKLPDFIKDEEVSLDLENPMIRLSLWSEVPTDVSLNAKLKGMRDNKQISSLVIGADYGTADIAFKGPQFGSGEALTTNIWVSRIPVESLPDTVDENVVIPEVMDIVRHMPDAIKIDAYARTDSTKVVTMSLSEKYHAVPKYEMSVPLKIGRDMKIVYNKDFEDLNKVLKHVDLNEIVIQAQAENHLPLDLSMKMEAYDSEGREIMGLTYGLPSEDDPIPGSLEGALPATGTKDITIRIKNTGQENCLHQVDHLRLKIYALSSAALEGQYLNRNQNLQLRNIKLLLK